MNPEFVKKMNAIAEGTPRDITDPTDDTTFERKSKDAVKLYRVSDASGSLEITEVGGYPLSRDLLDSNVSDTVRHAHIMNTLSKWLYTSERIYNYSRL